MVGLLTCKNEDDSIKNEGARMLTRVYINFSDTQGQLTPQSVLETGRTSFNGCPHTCQNEEDAIMKVLECDQHFSHY